MKLATQLRIQALAAAAVALVAATVLSLESDDATRIAGRLGPTPGPSSAGHIAAKRAYLERIAGANPGASGAALVSFSTLVSATEATQLVGDMETTVVFALFPETAPEAIALTRPLEPTVAARAAELALAVKTEIASLEAQERNAQGPAREEVTATLDRRRLALGALQGNCLCVYAVGVQETTLGNLARLQERAEVRLVDVPEPVVGDLRGWELHPIAPASIPS